MPVMWRPSTAPPVRPGSCAAVLVPSRVSARQSWLPWIVLVAILSVAALPGCAQSAATAKPQALSKAPASAPTNPADYVGAATCALCHQAEVNSFPKDPHARLELEHGGKGVTCESCHGPGRAHVESGGVASKIFQFSKATPRQVEATCLSCHIGEHPNFERTSHGQAGISCTNCHSVHAFAADTRMLKAKQPTLCYQCHTEIKAAFALPVHHRVNEGLLQCTDCHDPHGTFRDQQLLSNADQNAICTKCHLETIGPFVYEHPVVKVEGCTSCHVPHGSPNPRLLTRNNINSLCLQCHTASMNFTAPGTPSFHNQAFQYQSCLTCHVQIHGSNASSVFFQ
jgi:DmsE family decaheme c-type cytochrome